MGMGATNTLERVAASLGLLEGITPAFQTALDIPRGGVLFALPALLASGLLKFSETYFSLPRGYYRLDSLLILMAFMALARIKTVEALRYESPGEGGNLLGLDRSPEAKTLRQKIALLSEQQPAKWMAALCRDWREGAPDVAGTLYIDGHVRVYHGHQTKLPKHHVARQRLCLRATTDYWVNARDGQAFFVVNQAIDPGLIKVIEQEVVPQLEKRVAAQPNAEQLKKQPLQHRYMRVFDREGYRPDFFARMKAQRIACQTYHKFPGEDWPTEAFFSYPITLGSGHVVEMRLAERGSMLSNKLWLREIRKLSEGGHQTSVLSPNFVLDAVSIAGAMFARGSQENYFKYMQEQYHLDALMGYATEVIPDTTPLVNPAYRRLDGEVRKAVGKLNRRKAKFAALVLEEEIVPKRVEAYQQEKADLMDEIAGREKEIAQQKATRKATKKHITIAELPEEERFEQLTTQSKYFVDTIKMIAYRSETAMTNICRQTMSHSEELRSLLSAIYRTEADLIMDKEANTLTVRLHHLANNMSSITIQHLCKELTATECVFPGTELRVIYKMVAS